MKAEEYLERIEKIKKDNMKKSNKRFEKICISSYCIGLGVGIYVAEDKGGIVALSIMLGISLCALHKAITR